MSIYLYQLTSVYVIEFETMMTNLGGGRRQCNFCGFQSKSTNVKYHIESKHLESTEKYSCQYCDKVLRTKNALITHCSQRHRDMS